MRNVLKVIFLYSCLFFLHGTALAALGENEASIVADQAHMRAARRVVGAPQYTVHEIQLDSGTLVKEYLSSDGVVFAITWQGPFLPDLQQLLGRYFGVYTDAANDMRSGRGSLQVNKPELVVQSGGHMRAFSGRAYLPPKLPKNLSIDEIQ